MSIIKIIYVSLNYTSQVFQSFEKKYPTVAPIVYGLLGALNCALITLVAKMIPDIPTSQLLFSHNIYCLLLIYPFIQINSIDTYFKKNEKSLYKFLFLRCFSGFICNASFYAGVILLPASESMLLACITPLWVLLYCIIFQKSRKCSITIFMTITLCLLGVLIISELEQLKSIYDFFGIQINSEQTNLQREKHLLGILFLLISTFSGSILEISLQVLMKRTGNELLVMSNYSVFNIAVSGLTCVIGEKNLRSPTIGEHFGFLLMGIHFALIIFFMSRAFKLGNLATISLLNYSQIIYGFLFDIFVFHISFTPQRIFGNSLILVGLILNILFRSNK